MSAVLGDSTLDSHFTNCPPDTQDHSAILSTWKSINWLDLWSRGFDIDVAYPLQNLFSDLESHPGFFYVRNIASSGFSINSRTNFILRTDANEILLKTVIINVVTCSELLRIIHWTQNYDFHSCFCEDLINYLICTETYAIWLCLSDVLHDARNRIHWYVQVALIKEATSEFMAINYRAQRYGKWKKFGKADSQRLCSSHYDSMLTGTEAK